MLDWVQARLFPVGAEMARSIKVGDSVKLTGLPNWLLHDLPQEEQAELLTCIGRVAIVREIDQHGYIWLGFGSTIESDDHAKYTGHSFCVPSEFVETQT